MRDIDALNQLFADAFTERYRRDGLTGVRVPHLNPVIWQFAIEDADAGALVWRNGRGELIAFNMVHQSGVEGWMGPLAVRTDRQGSGLGRQVVQSGVDWLLARGATTIGLETMPRTVENIGFYSRLGFVPGHLTITLQREPEAGTASGGVRLGSLDGEARAAAIAACRALTNAVATGLDFTRELQLTLDRGLGDISLLRASNGTLQAFALWHSAPLALGRARDELRVLKLVAHDCEAAVSAVTQVEHETRAMGLGRLAVRCQTQHADLYARLVQLGWRVHWTDLRMTLAGRGEAVRRGILLSNWEI